MGAGNVIARVARYFDSPDPIARAVHRLVVVLLANQPTYPLFVAWVTGSWSPWLALTLVSTPLFCLVPWISRRTNSGLGRLAFPAVGAVNTVFCTAVFGRDSGVEAFLVPCVVIMALSLPSTLGLGQAGGRTDRRNLAVAIVFLYGAFIVGRTLPFGPVIALEPQQLAALVSLNAYSAASFTALSVWSLWNAVHHP